MKRQLRSGFKVVLWLPDGCRYECVTDKDKAFDTDRFIEEWDRTVGEVVSGLRKRLSDVDGASAVNESVRAAVGAAHETKLDE